jgi:hypothetical protein
MPTDVQDGAESLKVSHRMGDGPILLKTSALTSLMTTYRMNLFSVRSFSLDSTFNVVKCIEVNPQVCSPDEGGISGKSRCSASEE